MTPPSASAGTRSALDQAAVDPDVQGRARPAGSELPGDRLPSFLLIALALTGLRLVYLALSPYPLDGDEAQYWTYAKALDFGYYSKPPLVAWIIAAATALFGDSPFAIRLAAPLIHAAIAWLIFLGGRRLFGSATGFWSGVAYLTLPAVGLSAGLMSTDPPMMLGFALALYALIRALADGGKRQDEAAGRERIGWWLLLGAGLGLGLLAKYTAIAFLPGLFLYLLTTPAHRPWLRRKGPWLALLAMLAVASPNLIWNAAHDFVAIGHVGANADLAGARLHPGELAEFVGSQAGVAGPVLFAVLLWLLVRWPRIAREDRRLHLLLAIGAPLLLAIMVEALLSRANANWAAPFYIGGTVAAVAWLGQQGHRRWLLGSTLLNLALGVLLMGLGLAHTLMGDAWSGATDPFRKLRGAEVVGPALAGLAAAEPAAVFLFDHRLTMAQLLFYGRLPLARAVKWNPDGVADDHYELVTDLGAVGDRTIYYVSDRDPQKVLARFAAADLVRALPVRTHSDRVRDFRIYRLEGFRGYRGGGSARPAPAGAASKAGRSSAASASAPVTGGRQLRPSQR